MITDDVKKIEGIIEKVLFQNTNTGYIVMLFAIDSDPKKRVTAVGEIGQFSEGEHLRLFGEWTVHARFGKQFKAEYCERMKPTTTADILEYLESGAIKTISNALARRIVMAFKEESLEILENEPERLLELRGVSEKRMNLIRQEIIGERKYQEMTKLFMELEIRPLYATKAYQKFGAGLFATIAGNPYVMCEEGIDLDFKQTEKIAEHFGIDSASSERMIAGIKYVLYRYSQNGNTCMEKNLLRRKVMEQLEVDRNNIENYTKAYQSMLDDSIIFEYQSKKRRKAYVYLAEFFYAECNIAQYFVNHNTREDVSDKEIAGYYELLQEVEESLEMKYEDEQKTAVVMALCETNMILTGGPGTGKSATSSVMKSYCTV
mgnify:CR=1 FL=1